MSSKLRVPILVAVLMLAIASSVPTFGQVQKGSISGTVTDPLGQVTSGVAVKVTSLDTGTVFTTMSDNAGLFRLSLLPVGHYNVEIQAKDSKTQIIKDAMVVAGEDRGLGSIKMALGPPSETVEVKASNINSTTQSQVTNSISGVTLQTFSGIQEGQGLDKLTLFIPGVTNTRSDNFSNSNGSPFGVNGLRGRNNDQNIDGQNNNDNSIGGPGLFVTDPEFVQQYVLVTNQFGPEYGRNAGSVVNIITKSGSNAWHGSIYGTENNSALNALTNSQKLFSKLDRPPSSNNEFSGGTIGGPIIKNKLFFFGGFNDDILSQDSRYFSNSLTPTPAGLASLAGCPGINANALHVLTTYGPYGITAGNPTPLPNPTTGLFTNITVNGCTVQVGGVSRTVPNPQHIYNFFGKTDYHFGSSDTITGRYIFNRSNTFNNSDNGAGGWVDNVQSLSQQVLLSWTHNLSAHMVNEARVSFGRLNIEFGDNTIGNQFEPGAANIGQALTNITIGGGFLGIGPSTNLPQSRLVNTWQAQDNWNYVLGKHTFKAGVNWTYQSSPNTFLPNFNGQFAFSSFNNFILNNTPSTIRIAEGQTLFDFKEHDVFLYAGDDWKIAQNLTINLGLTWSYYGNPSNLFNQITTDRETGSTPFWNPALPLSVRTVPSVPNIYNNIGPSIGFAYSPQWGGFLTGHGKTVFRGGYRLLYDPPFYNIFLNMYDSAPTTFLQTFTGSQANSIPILANPIGTNVRTQLAPFVTLGTLDPRLLGETNVSPDFGPDKVNSWSFGFEREITKNSAFEARYVGNHAYNQYQTLNGNPFIGDLKTDFPNFVPLTLIPCSPSSAFNPVAVGRVNCNEGVVRTRANTGFSYYNGLQLEFRANNLFKQLTMRTGYTFSKNMDNTSEIFSTNSAGNTNAFSQNLVEPGRAEYGLSGLNFPQVWTLEFTEQVPFFKEQKGFTGHLLGGWSISGNYIIASGQPYTPSQEGEARITASGNFYDSTYLNQFVGIDTARPFIGNLDAPANSVGVFSPDLCRTFFGVTPSNNPTLPGACNTAITPVTQLLSFNSLNVGGFLHGPGTLPGQTPVHATTNSVRFIVNGGESQAIFGTPFGNAPRNVQSDARTNIFNLSVYKDVCFTERYRFQVHATALNLFNHYNFSSIDPFIENAGITGTFGQGFANPRVQSANGRTIYVGGKFSF